MARERTDVAAMSW